MVAWHEVPGMRKKKEPVPEGRCDYVFAGWSAKIALACAQFRDESTAAPTRSSCPSGTDRFFLRHSWHFVPGYSHESLRDKVAGRDACVTVTGGTPMLREVLPGVAGAHRERWSAGFFDGQKGNRRDGAFYAGEFANPGQQAPERIR